MCEVLGVSRAGYDRWRKRTPTPKASENERLANFLKRTAEHQHCVPGYRKLWEEAVAAGFRCSKGRVQRLLQRLCYRAASALKPGHRKTRSDSPVMPNLLNREFDVDQPNRVWVSDITQIHCHEGWLYLAVVIDLYDRQVVGWASDCINNAELVTRALNRAWRARRPDGQRLLFHSDQGTQYRSERVMRWLNRRALTFSMSRRGNCWDNACSESFFASLKKEWTHRLQSMSRQQMTQELAYYIDTFYHKIRRHSTLGYVTPAAFHKVA
jgi:putative transposase